MTGGTPVAGETLPGTGDAGADAPDRVVCHVDMD